MNPTTQPRITTVAWIKGQIEGLAGGLAEIAERIGPRFSRPEPRARAIAYIKALMSHAERKNGWQLAEEAGDMSPDGMQRLLNAAKWDADQVRDDLQDYVVEHFGEPEAIITVDETGFIKKGRHSAGVQRQYSGTAGKVENCQIGVFLGYVSSKGRALLDRALYLPKSWTSDPDRCREAQVPEEACKFATKPELARRMIAHALERGVPARWVTGDEVYGRDSKLRRFLQEQRLSYVLAVASTQRMPCGKEPVTAAELAEEIPPSAWKQMSAGNGAKGPREYNWAIRRLDALKEEGYEAWLLVRQSLGPKRERAYYWVFAPTETRLADMVKVAGSRWSIEESFERAKGEVGLDHYEVRLWPAWHRHMTLSMLALAYLDVVKKALGAEKGAPGASRRR